MKRHLWDSISIKHGTMKDVEVNLFSIVKNEKYLMPAFFEYYRKLGVQQFIILDDRSDDGTLEFLTAQTDCLVLSSRFTFGEKIKITGSKYKKKIKRAGTLLKQIIPKKYLIGKYAVYADADEFLILPKNIPDISTLIKKLNKIRIDCVAASLIEFYPQSPKSWTKISTPMTFNDLIEESSYFDAHPLFSINPGGQINVKKSYSFSKRLFRKYKIKSINPKLSWLPHWLTNILPFYIQQSPVLKTPIINWSDKVYMTGSHRANVPPPCEICLGIAHFKFTSDFAQKIKQAMKNKAHFSNSIKYFNYNLLLEKISESGDDFLYPLSRKFKDSDCLEKAGLTWWRLH